MVAVRDAVSWLTVRLCGVSTAPLLRLLCIDQVSVWTVDPRSGNVTARRSLSEVVAVGADARGTGLVRFALETGDDMTFRALEPGAAQDIAAYVGRDRSGGSSDGAAGPPDCSVTYYTSHHVLSLCGADVPASGGDGGEGGDSDIEHLVGLTECAVLSIVVSPSLNRGEPTVSQQWSYGELVGLHCCDAAAASAAPTAAAATVGAADQFALFFSTGHVLRFDLGASERPASCLALLLGRYSAHLGAALLAVEDAVATAAAAAEANLSQAAQAAHLAIAPAARGGLFDDDGAEAAATAAEGAGEDTAAAALRSGGSWELEGILLLQHLEETNDVATGQQPGGCVWEPHNVSLCAPSGGDAEGGGLRGAEYKLRLSQGTGVDEQVAVELPLGGARVYAMQSQRQRHAARPRPFEERGGSGGSADGSAAPMQLQLLVAGCDEHPLVLGTRDSCELRNWLAALSAAIGASALPAGTAGASRQQLQHEPAEPWAGGWGDVHTLAVTDPSVMAASLDAPRVARAPATPIMLSTPRSHGLAASGWLHVLDAKRRWKRRWCELLGSGDLVVFKQPEDEAAGKRPRGTLSTQGCMAQAVEDGSAGNDAGTRYFRWTLLHATTTTRIADLGAENDGDRQAWVTAINAQLSNAQPSQMPHAKAAPSSPPTPPPPPPPLPPQK
jgi:hypothetical protein